jgi:hypothetical protein
MQSLNCQDTLNTDTFPFCPPPLQHSRPHNGLETCAHYNLRKRGSVFRRHSPSQYVFTLAATCIATDGSIRRLITPQLLRLTLACLGTATTLARDHVYLSAWHQAFASNKQSPVGHDKPSTTLCRPSISAAPHTFGSL